MKRAVVAISGGIDSSVCAKLLQDEGYEVIGLTGKTTNLCDNICKNAQKVADTLGIKLHILDCSNIFKEKVINYFETSYINGLTPNPCIMCNKFIKWGYLFDYAINELKADVFSTGHYADIKIKNGVYKLYPAKDTKKDQLYFLHKLNQNQLSKTIFPLSAFTKEEVKKIAVQYNLPTKDSKESQDICFIQKPMTTKKYLSEKFKTQQGDFIEIGSGRKLGKHDGYFLYTIGQRKGIGIAATDPLYVIDIDAEKNIIYLGNKGDNYKSIIALQDINFTYPFNQEKFIAFVKIRYNMQPVKAECQIINNIIEIRLHEPVNAITPGQYGVLYDIKDKHLIGGGTII